MTSDFDFDQLIERRNSDSIKWNAYPQDVLPLWVADMDFISPPAVMAALHQRVDQGIFGYASAPEELTQTVVDRMKTLYNWEIEAESIVYLPGIVTGLNQYCHAFSPRSTGVIVQTPVYPPFLEAPINAGLERIEAPLRRLPDGRYEIDFDALEDRMKKGARLFILCNPHNPVGRVYSPIELQRVAELCDQYDVLLCADEIHSDLVYPGHAHHPIAALSKSIAARTVTFIAPSKTYNVAGLSCAMAIISDHDLRREFAAGAQGLVPHVNIMGYTAALAAFREGEDWLRALRRYLLNNRDMITAFIQQEIPDMVIYPAEGTYLAWLDCRQLQLPGGPTRFFLEECKVALNNGTDFGREGEGFVRMNFGCPTSTLQQALERMAEGIRKRKV